MEALPTLDTCQQMIESINNDIVALEARRAYWEQLGHVVVEHIVEEQTHGSL